MKMFYNCTNSFCFSFYK